MKCGDYVLIDGAGFSDPSLSDKLVGKIIKISEIYSNNQYWTVKLFTPVHGITNWNISEYNMKTISKEKAMLWKLEQ